MKYEVMAMRFGFTEVEADTAEEAKDIVRNSFHYNDVEWYGWDVVDARPKEDT